MSNADEGERARSTDCNIYRNHVKTFKTVLILNLYQDYRSTDSNETLNETPIDNLLKELLFIKSNVDCSDDEYVVKHLQTELDNWDEIIEKEVAKGVEKVGILKEELAREEEEYGKLT